MPVLSFVPKFSTIYSIVTTSPGWTLIFEFTGLKFQIKFGWTLVNKFIDNGKKQCLEHLDKHFMENFLFKLRSKLWLEWGGERTIRNQ